jgi:hypothetical protein
MDIDENVVRTLNRIATILQIAHEDRIAQVRQEVRKDKSYKAILDLASDWTPAGKLRDAVVKAGQSPRTFLNKANELVDRGLLERRGSGPNVSYRSTGVIFSSIRDAPA